ncbi:hypothetical protein [Ralstonia solanacearum]|uniref:Uncharacterized protein n=2 Tax=Ralstonia solanacearum TaxID=305 RepID=A0A5H2PX52_RALSL|nr:hypothetical protein [Ralstonia solanacearum]AEG71866.1 hypothetical protein RSPO_m01230 [Ralstonia solanacearum Po82]AMP71735.1 hypothetical protein UW163_19815 [Ralstonia solanacearum]AMP76328.1 hypothetical protein RALBFv3_19290 [Ralstonia solanacearum]AYB63146.1 hypothetical protein C2124_22035 [Ralstonia solanacearum]EUJ12198.1 hypothetical protein RSP673_21925 [Ralstonia solanacearum P673]
MHEQGLLTMSMRELDHCTIIQAVVEDGPMHWLNLVSRRRSISLARPRHHNSQRVPDHLVLWIEADMIKGGCLAAHPRHFAQLPSVALACGLPGRSPGR